MLKRLRSIYCIILASIILTGMDASAQVYRRCFGVHTVLTPVARPLTNMLFGQLNTTGNRVEEKRVNQSKDLKILIQQMDEMGFRVRDAVAPGTVSVTQTEYMPDLKFSLDGKNLTAKTRFRKYGTRKKDSLNGEFTPIERMKNISIMENKIEHPNTADAVIKRQLFI